MSEDPTQDQADALNTLRRLIEERKAEANSAGGEDDSRTRGYAKRVLMPRIAELRDMTVSGFSLREQLQMLEASGVKVGYVSYRKFLMRYLADDYERFVSTSKKASSWKPAEEQQHVKKEKPADTKQSIKKAEKNVEEEYGSMFGNHGLSTNKEGTTK